MNDGVAVVIPTHNRPTLVVRAVDSALAHRPVVCEVIVVDDGSTDDIRPVLHPFEDRIMVLTGENLGPAAARNRGLAAASSAWICFLDDDDLLAPTWSCIEPMLATDALLVSGSVEQHTAPSPAVLAPAPLGPQYFDLVSSTLAGSWIARRELLLEIGGYDPRYRHSENVELFLRLSARLARSRSQAHTTNVPLLVRPTTGTTGRLSSDDANKVAAVQLLEQHHRDQLSRLPAGRAALLRAGAVAAARLGDLAQARRWLLGAAMLDRAPSDVARWAIASSRWSSRRVWGEAPAPSDP